MKNYLPKQPITNKTLKDYLREKFGVGYVAKTQKTKFIKGVNQYLQEDYGLRGDCTITSMSCVLEFLYHLPFQQIYDTVEAIAKSYGYNGENGTNPLFISSILKKAERNLGVDSKVKHKAAYGKNIGFNFELIEKWVEAQHPLILSMSNDGRNFYTSHSVTVTGYIEFLVNGQKQRFLMLQDNWRKERTYLDFEILSSLCSLNYYV